MDCKAGWWKVVRKYLKEIYEIIFSQNGSADRIIYNRKWWFRLFMSLR